MRPRLLFPALCAAAAACGDANRRAAVVEQPPPETTVVAAPAPPPPAPLALRVSPKTIVFDALSDTVRLAVPEGAECRSAADLVAVVEQASLVRATGNGTTHLRCWREGRVASVKVTVRQQLARVAITAEQGFNIRQNGDSVRLALARTDRLGVVVEAARPSWLSLEPAVVRIDPTTGVAVGIADSGTARIVAQADGMADTVTVEIGLKSSDVQLLSTSSRNASRARLLARRSIGLRATQVAGPGGVVQQSFGGPAVQSQGPRLIGARDPQGRDSLFRDPATGEAGRPRFAAPFVAARSAEHRIDAGSGLERTSGALFGAGVDLITRGVLSFRFQFLSGKLTADDSLANDRTVTSGTADFGLQLSPWLTILGGVEARRYEALAIERWIAVRAGGEATINLGGGPLRGIARILVMPLVSLASDQGIVTAPSFGLMSALGLGFENRRIVSSLTYNIERYSFPSSVNRDEEFGSLLFRFGYKVGW